MSEKTAYQTMRRNIIRPGDRMDRIENLVGTGFPDVNCCLEGNELWIEIKAPKEPKRKTTRLFGSNHKLLQEQKNWFLAQRNAGGRAFVYIETDTTRLLVPNGPCIDRLNDMTLTEIAECSVWIGYNRKTPPQQWAALRAALLA